MRVAVCHNGTNPPVNYYKITTKLNTLCFKPFQVFYLKSVPVRSGSPDWKVRGQWTRLCWCSNIYCISKVFPLLFWAKLWGRSQQLEPRGKVCSDVSYREESWRVAEGDRPWVLKLTWQDLKRVPCHVSLMMEGSGFLTVASVLRFGAGVEGRTVDPATLCWLVLFLITVDFFNSYFAYYWRKGRMSRDRNSSSNDTRWCHRRSQGSKLDTNGLRNIALPFLSLVIWVRWLH